MDISIPREIRADEYRIALTPAGVEALIKAGHRVYVEHNAGALAGFEDDAYRAVGGQIIYSHEEAFRRAQIVAKFTRPTLDELRMMSEGQILLGFLHLAAGRREKIQVLKEHGVIAIGWETVQLEDGVLPVLHGISTIAGRFLPQIVGRFLQSNEGGRGVMMSGCATVPPAEIVILGAGTIGTEAALALAGNKASVYVLDINPAALERASRLLDGRGVTMYATATNIRKMVRFADAVIGAVYVAGQRTPILLSRADIRSMRPRSLFVDVSIDQGGCAETSRPTTHSNPTYVAEGVLHYCVPNITSVVGRTITHAMTYLTLPYLLQLANEGVDGAIRAFPELGRGVNIREGQVIHEGLKTALTGRGEA